MVALLHRGDAGADIDDDAGAFMAENGREEAFRIGARQGEIIGVADTRRLDLHQHFAGLRAFQLHGHHFERFSCLNGNGGANVHFDILPLKLNSDATYSKGPASHRSAAASQPRFHALAFALFLHLRLIFAKDPITSPAQPGTRPPAAAGLCILSRRNRRRHSQRRYRHQQRTTRNRQGGFHPAKAE